MVYSMQQHEDRECVRCGHEAFWHSWKGGCLIGEECHCRVTKADYRDFGLMVVKGRLVPAERVTYRNR